MLLFVGVDRKDQRQPAPILAQATPTAQVLPLTATTAFAVVPAQVIPNVHLDITVMKEYAKKHRKQLWYMR